jgi:hypothetical protein
MRRDRAVGVFKSARRKACTLKSTCIDGLYRRKLGCFLNVDGAHYYRDNPYDTDMAQRSTFRIEASEAKILIDSRLS